VVGASSGEAEFVVAPRRSTRDRIRRSLSRAIRPRLPTRANIAAVGTCLERHVLARRAGVPEVSGPRILAYHAVGTWQWGLNDVRPARFRRHLELAVELGYRFAPAAELAAAGTDSPERVLAVTFDDGLRSVLDTAAPVMVGMGIPWTIFVVTDWVDGLHETGAELMLGWDDLERVVELGGNVGSHSASHPDFGRISPGQAEDELVRSRETIQRRLGIDVTEFAIPFGQSANWSDAAGPAAARAGYELVYAQSEERRPAGTVPRTFITRYDTDRVFGAALSGAFRAWEERV
jgi:peptidoglycan/xylan/chitin deacetylase (PgdA/CDA1 family)